MKYFLLFLSFLVVLINPADSIAQCDQCEHLEPAKGIFDDWEFSIEYNLKLREYFLDELPEYYEIRYIVTPSFENEYVFQISRDTDTDKLKAYLLIGESSIWYDVVSRKPYEENPYSEDGKTGFDKNNPPPISKKNFEIKDYKADIDSSDFRLIKELMDLIILQTTHSPPSNLIGTDGTTYFFSVWMDGTKSGEIWSPNEGTKMDRLISIFEEMCKRTKQKRKLRINGDLETQIEELKKDINESNH